MEKPIPSSEEDRVQEALELIGLIRKEEYSLLSSWEKQTISAIQEGKAATAVRLLELRNTVKRLQKIRDDAT